MEPWQRGGLGTPPKPQLRSLHLGAREEAKSEKGTEMVPMLRERLCCILRDNKG